MAKNTGYTHKVFEDYQLQKVKTGWLVTVKGEHKLKGVWHFKDHVQAVDFINEGKFPVQRSRSSAGSNNLIYVILFAAALAFLIYNFISA
jgi:hypothetical protein